MLYSLYSRFIGRKNEKINDMSEDVQASINELKKEKENFLYMAEGLTYDHQSETRYALLRKADNIQFQIDELIVLIKNE